MADPNFLINTRKHLRTRVTEAYKKKDSYITYSTIDRARTRAILLDILDKLNTLNPDIQKLKWAAKEDISELNWDLSKSDDYNSNLRECLILLEDRPVPKNSSIDIARSLLKSPVAPLPKFSSTDEEDFTSFLIQFEDTVSRFSYPEYDKLLLLKQQLSGSALTLVNSLEANKNSYSEAKSLLESAFASPVSQKFKVIKQISEMKLSINGDLFEYISKIRKLSESVNSLDITSESFMR